MARSRRLGRLIVCVFLAVDATYVGAMNQEPCVCTFDSNGVQIAYVDQGHGDPVVLLHGFTGHLGDWPPMCKALLDTGYRVIAMDARGHGQSGKPHDPASYGPEMADDVIRLLDHLHIARAHVIGYSMGGDIANKVRERHPSRLITTTLGGVGKGVAKGWTTSDFDHTRLADSLERGDGLKVLLREPGGPGKQPLSENEIETMNASAMKGQDKLALAAVIRAYAELEVSDESLKNNSVPTLVVVGEDDTEKPTADEWKEVMTNVRIEVIPNADHYEAGLRPEFFAAVLKFLRSYPDK